MNLIALARAVQREGKRLAWEVRRGHATRSQVEELRRAYPHDAEPAVALYWLDRWGIK